MIDVGIIYADLCALLEKDETLFERMQKALSGTPEDTRRACRELSEFLILKSLYPEKSIPPTERVDALWHEFILHTEPYRKFCENHFGRFIDHRPTR